MNLLGNTINQKVELELITKREKPGETTMEINSKEMDLKKW